MSIQQTRRPTRLGNAEKGSTPRRCMLRTRGAMALLTVAVMGAGVSLHAQISLGSAVDLALRNSPRVKSSEADVARAQSILAQSKDIFIPSLSAGAALGQAYGYSPYPPTLFNLNASSLIYNGSQFSYIHSARAGVDAAQHSLEDMREIVAEDAALSFLALDHDQKREEVLAQESSFTDRLLQIVQDRFDAGQDSRMDLINAKLSVANLRLARLRTSGDTANDRDHLARLMGIPAGTLRADGGFPPDPVTAPYEASTGGYGNASVASAFANARAKQLQARGDSTFLYRPQVSFVGQYERYATFTNAFRNLKTQYGGNLSANEEVFGVQISIPLFDRLRKSKGIESAAEASKALHDAEFSQVNVLDAQGRLKRTMELAQAQAEVAALEQERAQEQLEILQLQLSTPGSTPQPLTPKDEQNSRIVEREKYLVVVDAGFQLHQAEVSLLRQTGHLQDWLRHAGLTIAPQTPSTPPGQP